MKRHPPWRQVVIVLLALPLVITLAVLAFAWPVGRIAPRDLPVGIVGASTASQDAVEGLARSVPGGFDFHLYPDEASARSAIKDRDVYGAFIITPDEVTVVEATAAGPSVAQLLGTVGQQLANHAPRQAAVGATSPARPARRAHGAPHRPQARAATAALPPAKVRVTTVDAVPTSGGDPRGLVFGAVLLPVTTCSILIAAAITFLGRLWPAWRRILALVAVCAAAGAGIYLVAQGFLGALPHQPTATWAALSLTLLTMSATTAGLATLIGPAGIGVGAALMLFIGNPFSGVTSAPQLLPKAVDYIGQSLPPGAGASLLRSTAYFGGNGSAGKLGVLAVWSVLGLAAVAFGRRTRAEDASAAIETMAPRRPLPDEWPVPTWAEQPPYSHARHDSHARHAYGNRR